MIMEILKFFIQDSKKRWFAEKFDKDGIYKGSSG